MKIKWKARESSFKVNTGDAWFWIKMTCFAIMVRKTTNWNSSKVLKTCEYFGKWSLKERLTEMKILITNFS